MTKGNARKTVTRRMALGLLASALLSGGRARAEGGVSDADRAALVAGNSEFGLDLYAKLRTTDGNLFYSPYSISSALGMTWAGARGATADEMAKTLRFALDPGRLHPAFTKLTRGLAGEKRTGPGELYTANALWSQRGHPFIVDFVRVAKTAYGAGLQEVDFERATETARRTINAWAEKQTQDKIKDLIKEGVLGSDTVLVLTNAIYFKGDWMQAFRKDLTRPGEFALGGQDTVRDVPFMHQSDTSFRYLRGDTFEALDLPYKNNVSMIVFLPRAVDGLADFEKTLTAARLTGWLAQMRPVTVAVALPRFKITAARSLKQPLIDLGMPLAFDQNGADFSGMTARPVYLGAVEHKAYVDVNEQGTEAAAATAAVVRERSARPSQPVFRADHPFFFLIRDNRTETILFSGRLANPKAT